MNKMDRRKLAQESYKEIVVASYDDKPMYWHLWKRAFDRAWVMFKVESKDQRIKELEDLLQTLIDKNMCSVAADGLIQVTLRPSKITTK